MRGNDGVRMMEEESRGSLTPTPQEVKQEATDYLQTLSVAATWVMFILFIAFVYAAIWFQSIICAELSGASFVFSIVFGWFLVINYSPIKV